MNGTLDYCVTVFMSDHPDVVIEIKDDTVHMQKLGGSLQIKRTVEETKKDLINNILDSMYKEFRR